MQETLFVSDVHLDAKRSAVVDLFNQFLLKRAIHADALYILGDLFEYWIGDDAPYLEYQATFQALQSLTSQQVPIYFLHGNRDFLVAQRFAKQTGVSLLSEESIATIYNQNILLMHGDTLCTDDLAYQNFRKKTHNKLLQWLVLHLPVSTRQKLAEKLRNTSSQAVAEKSAEIMDVNQTAVEDVLARHETTCLIHGHTHRPKIHEFSLNNKLCTRAVLGDWYQQGSVLSVTPEGMNLQSFSEIS